MDGKRAGCRLGKNNEPNKTRRVIKLKTCDLVGFWSGLLDLERLMLLFHTDLSVRYAFFGFYKSKRLVIIPLIHLFSSLSSSIRGSVLYDTYTFNSAEFWPWFEFIICCVLLFKSAVRGSVPALRRWKLPLDGHFNWEYCLQQSMSTWHTQEWIENHRKKYANAPFRNYPHCFAWIEWNGSMNIKRAHTKDKWDVNDNVRWVEIVIERGSPQH